VLGRILERELRRRLDSINHQQEELVAFPVAKALPAVLEAAVVSLLLSSTTISLLGSSR
jgi:TctA family transporter